MCLSPQSQRSNISIFFKDNNTCRNKSKDDTNKINNKKLTSRNKEIFTNSKHDNYKKIIPKNLINFSSNNSNSTSSNNSNLNIARTYKNIFRECELSSKDSDFMKKNRKHFKKNDLSDYINLLNFKNEKNQNLFKKYKTKINNNSKKNVTNIQNRTMNRNYSKDLLISKLIDKLAISNLNRLSNINSSSNSELIKYDLENTLLGSMTTRNYNSFMNSNNDKIFNFPISTNHKSNKSVININPAKSKTKCSSKKSSPNNIIYSKTSSSKVKSNKLNRPNSNDNLIRNKNNQKDKKNKKVINLSKDNASLTLNKGFLPQKKLGNDVRLNNNKIEYVQINLFNNKNDDKISKEHLQIYNESENKNGCNKKNKNGAKKSSSNKKKLVINENGGFQDNIVITKSFLCYNNNKSEERNLDTPEENHFQAILYLQLIKKNSNIYS